MRNTQVRLGQAHLEGTQKTQEAVIGGIEVQMRQVPEGWTEEQFDVGIIPVR
jgi:hypothetical protein